MSVVERDREVVGITNFEAPKYGTRWRIEFVGNLKGTHTRKVERDGTIVEQVARIGSEPVRVTAVEEQRSDDIVRFVAATGEPSLIGLMQEVRRNGAEDADLRHRQGAEAARLDVIDGMRIRMAEQEISPEAWDSFGDMIAWAPLDSTPQ